MAEGGGAQIAELVRDIESRVLWARRRGKPSDLARHLEQLRAGGGGTVRLAAIGFDGAAALVDAGPIREEMEAPF